MEQIKTDNDSSTFGSSLANLRRKLSNGIKWWAEHQAWPTTDEIRIDRHRSTCG